MNRKGAKIAKKKIIICLRVLCGLSAAGGEYSLSLQKPESFRAKASEGEVVVFLLQILSNTGSEVLRLSRRVNNMAK